MKKVKFFFYLYSLLLFLSILYTPSLFAHGNEKHGKKPKAQQTDTIQKATTTPAADSTAITGGTVTGHEHAAHKEGSKTVHASISDFPHIHPLIVHFPIMLLLIAAAIQLVNIFFLKKELNWAVTIMVLIGFFTAYASSYWYHPHTAGLSEHAKLVLEQHDKYANYTVYLSGLGLLAQLLSLFLLKGKRWSIAVAAVILSGAAYSVSMAGHYGAQLVHIEGIGPQGKFLEEHHH